MLLVYTRNYQLANVTVLLIFFRLSYPKAKEDIIALVKVDILASMHKSKHKSYNQ